MYVIITGCFFNKLLLKNPLYLCGKSLYSMTKKHCLLILILLISNWVLCSNLNITRLPIVDFLPNNNVKKIFQSSDGYMWLGTEGGLCRYDGYEVLQIDNMTNIDISTNILCITEDKYQRIWAGTRQGIEIVNRHGQSINLFNDHEVQEKRINTVCCAGDSVWIGTDEGIYLYNMPAKTFEIFRNNPKTPNSLPANNVVNIFSDKQGEVWIALWNSGLCKFNKKLNIFKKLPAIGQKNNPFHIMQDSKNVMWVSSWGDGLVRIELNPSSTEYSYTYYNIGGKNVVYTSIDDNSGEFVWLITPDGLFKRSKQLNAKSEYINIRSVYEKSSNFFHTITKDTDGNIWVGASNDGVYLVNTQESRFGYNILPEIKNKVGYSIVNSIEEIDGLLWMGLTNAGVIALDPKNNYKTRYYNSLNNTSIRHLKQDAFTKKIWAMGDESYTIDYKNKANPNIEKIAWATAHFQASQNANCVFFDAKNNQWVGSQYGLFYKNRNEPVVKLADENFNNIACFASETDSTFWVASFNKGISHITIGKNKAIKIKKYNLKNKLTPTSMIVSLKMDSHHNLWVGTSDCGLCLYDKGKDIFVMQKDKFALLEKTITNIMEDGSGKLWLSSNNKIIRVDPVKQYSSAFSSADNNIQVSTFRPLSANFYNDSIFYFGGNEGFCYFKPESKNTLRSKNRKVLITNMKVFNQSIFQADADVEFDESELVLKYNQNSISIEFSSLNFHTSSNVKYAYKLTGFDNNWIYVDSKRRYANYNNLTSGRYTFEVKTTNTNGIWSESVTTMQIKVKPAPYFSWWAYSIYFVMLMLLLYATYRLVINRIKLQNEALIARIEKEKTEELVQAKLKYFTNVSHELLTPLTIISCIVDEIRQKYSDENIQYPTIKANINRLKRLLQQILDFRKTESANMKLRVEEDDLVAFVRNICGYNFRTVFAEKNIKFNIESTHQELMAWFDNDKVDKILFNLLSNAAKYTPEGGTVTVRINTKTSADNQQIATIEVADTGMGISDELLPRIFDRFVSYKPNRAVETNGIGLSLVKDLLIIHLGDIRVESMLNEGSKFEFYIPIDKTNYEGKENVEVVEKNRPISNMHEQVLTDTSISDFSILFLEDNVDLSASLNRYFSEKCRVSMALNAEIALEMLNENELDLIVSDIMLPGIDGVAFCKIVKSKIETSHIPILILTAKNLVEDRIKCYDAGADAYISKPFELELLEARIRNLLNKRKIKNETYKSSLDVNISELEYNSIDEEFLKEAIKVVEENIADFDFTQEVLMAHLNSTRSTLYRKLKSLTGLSPSEFIKNIRMKHACAMLEKGSGNISDVAYAIGFNDPRYFSTCFRQEFGITPTEYFKEKRTNTNPTS